MSEDISYRIGPYYGEPGDLHIWEIRDAQGIAAELYVSLDRHEIMNVEVRADRRRQGLARALYVAALAQMPIYHAPAAHRTAEGDAFAEAVGGETLAYDCDCAACTHEEE
jgi:hypothetical protein